MELKLCLLVGLSIFSLSSVQHVAASTEALRECGRVHQIDNIANLSIATASYSNSRCILVCVIGSAILPVDSIHEGRSCPEDTNGICRAGQCIGGQEDALRECGLRHSVDFHKVDNHQGTAFANEQCALRCVLDGIELPVSHMHEGALCPGNHNGTCLSGSCVAQSTDKGSTVTPIPSTTSKQATTVTTVPPTTITQPSINLLFSPSKMQLLNISLESTDSSLKQNIYLHFRKKGKSFDSFIGIFDGSQTKPNYYYSKNLNDIPKELNRDSYLRISVAISNSRSEDEYLYPLFETFYKNRKLAFGEQENFVAKFPIQQSDKPYLKLMDVSLRFTIVFSKD